MGRDKTSHGFSLERSLQTTLFKGAGLSSPGRPAGLSNSPVLSLGNLLGACPVDYCLPDGDRVEGCCKTRFFLPPQQDVAEHRRTRKGAKSKMCYQVYGKGMVLEKTKQSGIAKAGKELRGDNLGV